MATVQTVEEGRGLDGGKKSDDAPLTFPRTGDTMDLPVDSEGGTSTGAEREQSEREQAQAQAPECPAGCSCDACLLTQVARAFLARAVARPQQLPNLVTHKSKQRLLQLVAEDLDEAQQILLLLPPESPAVRCLWAELRQLWGPH